MPDLSRFPWRTRGGLIVLVNAVAAFLLSLGGDAAVLDGWVSTATMVVTLLVSLGLVRSGEARTTPVRDPRTDDGTPLVRERT